MNFLTFFKLGYSALFRHFGVFIFFNVLVYALLASIPLLELKFQFLSKIEDFKAIIIGEAIPINYKNAGNDLSLFGLFLSFVILLNCFTAFICFESDKHNVFGKIFRYIKFTIQNFYKLFPIFIMKFLVMLFIVLLPFIFIFMTEFFLNKMMSTTESVAVVIRLLTFPTIALGVLLIGSYYLKLCLVEYAALLQKDGFWKAFEINTSAINDVKIVMLLIILINLTLSTICGLIIFNFIREAASSIKSTEILILFLNNKPLIALSLLSTMPIHAMYGSMCYIFKVFAFKNDQFSADKIWNSILGATKDKDAP